MMDVQTKRRVDSWVRRFALAPISIAEFPMITGRSIVAVMLLAWMCMLGGCNVIALPMSLPVALATNHVMSFSSYVVDDQGRPIRGATVTAIDEFAYPRMDFLWELSLDSLLSSHETTRITRSDDGYFQTTRWTSGLTFRFEAAGYYPRTFHLRDGKLEELLPEDGRTFDGVRRYVLNLTSGALAFHRPMTIPLDRVEHPAKLIHYDRWPSEYPDGSMNWIDLEAPPLGSGPLPTTRVENPQLPANALYIKCQWITPPQVSQGNGGDYARPGKLGGIELRCNAKDGGLMRIATKYGRPVEGPIREAPVSGYAAALVLSAEDLAALNQQHGFPFFVRTEHRYGRGMIHSALTHSDVTLCVETFMQPDGSRNVE